MDFVYSGKLALVFELVGSLTVANAASFESLVFRVRFQSVRRERELRSYREFGSILVVAFCGDFVVLNFLWLIFCWVHNGHTWYGILS